MHWKPLVFVGAIALLAFLVVGVAEHHVERAFAADPADAWPNHVACPAGDPVMAGQRLIQIRDAAIDAILALPAGDPQGATLKSVLQKAWTCAAFDGTTAAGPHSGDQSGASTQVWTAYQAILQPDGTPRAPQDWQACLQALDHPH